MNHIRHDADKGEYVVLTYDSSYGGKQTVEGTVTEQRSEWTVIETDDGTEYYVYGIGMKNRSKGEVVRDPPGDGRKQKVGAYVEYESPNERVSVQIYGSAGAKATIDRDEWEAMDDDERREWCRDHFYDVTAYEPSSYDVDETRESGHW